MNTILHDPTRGWLLLTEKWPGEKPDSSPVIMVVAPHFRNNMDGVNAAIDKIYNQAVAHCLSTAIEIQREDWDAILDTDQFFDQVEVNDGKYQYSKIQDHHPYSVDAEFEVGCEVCIDCPWPLNCEEGCSKEIARLVKAKEYKCADCGAEINEGEFKTFGVCDECWDKANPKPTESQDELWRELESKHLVIYTDTYYPVVTDEGKSKFRIERI